MDRASADIDAQGAEARTSLDYSHNDWLIVARKVDSQRRHRIEITDPKETRKKINIPRREARPGGAKILSAVKSISKRADGRGALFGEVRGRLRWMGFMAGVIFIVLYI